MDRNKVKRALKDLEARRIDGICSCELISEGVDIPAVSAGIMLRPTQSLSLWLQQLGRCLRPAEGFDKAIILDHAGNSLVHGFAHDEREWSLQGEGDEDGIKRKRAQREREAKMMECAECHLMHERGPVCPGCGHQHAAENIVAPGQLVEYDSSGKMSRIDTRMREEDWAAIFSDMVRGGYSQRWARERYRDIYGQEKFYTIGNRLILPDTATAGDKQMLYENWLADCKAKGHKAGRAANQYKDFFGVWPQGFVTEVKQRVGYGIDTDTTPFWARA
jgi:ribosomal protein L32